MTNFFLSTPTVIKFKSATGAECETRCRILGRNPEKSPKSFLLAIHSHVYSFALSFPFLQTHAASYSFCSSTAVHSKGERRKTNGGLRNPYKNLKSENSQDYAQKPQRNCMLMNSASVQLSPLQNSLSNSSGFVTSLKVLSNGAGGGPKLVSIDPF